MKYIFLLLCLGALVLPLLLSFIGQIKFVQFWKFAFPSIAISLLLFVPLDLFFVNAGIKGFNAHNLVGIDLIGLPVEEWLFMFTITYTYLLIFQTLRSNLINPPFPYMGKSFSVFLAVVLILVVIFNPLKYTSIVFFGLSVFLLIHQFALRTQWLGFFHLSYLLIILPLVIINSILAGSFIDSQMVWYNNNFNLGDRIHGLPIENIFYDMFLVLSAVTPYELMKKKWSKIKTPDSIIKPSV